MRAKRRWLRLSAWTLMDAPGEAMNDLAGGPSANRPRGRVSGLLRLRPEGARREAPASPVLQCRVLAPRLFLMLAALAVLPLLRSADAARAQGTAAQTQRPRYEYRAEHDPDGTGKFYMGREIAQVMGHQAADWLDRPERESEEAPSLLLRLLKLKPGMTVADIGAGSGYLTIPMAKMVAPGGKAYGEDIQPEMLALIRKRMKERGVPNVVPWLGTITDPKLPPNSVDLMLLVDVYHEFDHPWEMTQAMVRALKPGGRLVFVEYRKEDPSVPIKEVHKMTEAQVKREMSVQPLRWVETIEKLPRQHVIIFEKPPVHAAHAAH